MNKIEQFNNEYNLGDLNKGWFKQISPEEYNKKSNKNVIVGKPTKVWKDITKRFFTNKWNILFTSIFMLVILFLIFGGLLSNFSDAEPVSNAHKENISLMRPTNVPVEHIGDFNNIKTLFGNQVTVDTSGADPKLVLGGKYAGLLVDSKVSIVGGNSVWTIHYKNIDHVNTIFGTDVNGVDVYSRLVSSSRFSIGLAFLVTTIEAIFGTIVGLYLGYNAGRAIDTYFMRLIEIFTAVPALLLVTIFVLILGNGFTSMLIALFIIGWVGPVYVTRMFTIKVKDAEFIKVSQSIGASQSRIIFKHVLPNVIGRILVSFVHRIPAVIFIESTLVFLNIPIGGDARNTLGNMLTQARNLHAIDSNIWFLIAPTSVILLFTLSLQIIANGLRDAFDAKVSS